jgi:dipeptidyl aminopeptidase/acylaminoacyl peptidase
MPSVRPFDPSVLLRETLVQELALSPDGSTVVYARRTIVDGEYRKRLWRVPYARGRAEPLTTGDLDARPRFSPDGRTLLFLSGRSGSLEPWLLPLGGGEPSRLCELPHGAIAAEWSPDGKRILLVGASDVDRFLVGSRERPVARRIDSLTWRLDGVGVRDQFASLWVVSVGESTPRRVTEPTYQVFGAAWAADGSIGFLADRTPQAALGEYPQAWTVASGGGRPTRLGRLAGRVASLAFSADGRLALLGVDRPGPRGWENGGVYVREGRRLRQLGAELDRPVGLRAVGDFVDFAGLAQPPLFWLDDESLLTLVTDRGSVVPYRFPLGGPPEPLAAGPFVCSHLAAAAGRIVVVATEQGRPAEVCAVEDGRLRTLSRNGSRWLALYRRDPVHHVVRHRDGHALDAWLLPGSGARRRRLVLHVHGGPHLAHAHAPWLEMLALASAGFSVLYGNPRGSVGQGEEFGSAITGDWGGKDVSDVLRLADWAVRRGLADRDRIGLLGLSYGGYMTNWLLGRHPGRFRAAVSENPVTDLVGEFASSDVGWLVGPSAAGVDLPSDDWQRFLDHSPVRDIDRNEAPLLLLQAEGDLRCPPGQSDVVFTLLRLLGRTVELVRYPDESHVMLWVGRPDRRIDRLERIVDWFERYL